MRDIKFRAWDKHHKCMEYITDFYWFEENHFHGTNAQYGFECELMQYTSQKDKNGTEIYEGDIVKYSYYEWDEPVDFMIVWDAGFSRFAMMSVDLYSNLGKLDHYGEFYAGDFQDYEVIGNIYENPELLQNKHGKIDIDKLIHQIDMLAE